MQGTRTKLTVEEFTRLKRVNAVAASPCGTWLAVEVTQLDGDDAGWVSHLWKVSLTEPAQPPRRLTRGPASHRAPCFRPDGGLGFLSNRNPDEGSKESEAKLSQVWLLPPDGGEPRPLTDEPLGVLGFRFATCGDRLLVTAPVLPGIPHEKQRETHQNRQKHGPSGLHYKQMPVRFWDHWLPQETLHFIAYDQEGKGRKDLTPHANREYRQASWDLSPDGTRLATTCYSHLHEDRIYNMSLLLLDTATGDQTELLGGSTILWHTPLFSSNGRQLACLRQERFEDRCHTHQLWCIQLDTQNSQRLAATWDRWPTPVAWSADDSTLYVTADDQGTVPIFRIDIQDGQVDRLSAPEAAGSHLAVQRLPNAAEETLIGLRHRFSHPPEPFQMPAQPDSTPHLLAALSGFQPEKGEAFFHATTLTTTAEDGAQVPTILLTPPTEGPHPTLVWIHGGPISQSADGWHWRWNPLLPLSAGYAVAMPNPRGSTGLGHDFTAGIWGTDGWGNTCYHDIMRVCDDLSAHPQLDEDRFTAMGGSFGGYMVNWLGGHTTRFRSLVSHAGIFHFSMFYGTTDLPGWFTNHKTSHPLAARDTFERDSPHRVAQHWRTPTLIIHGEKDYRVPVSEALFLFETLQAQGVPSELLVFPDENHWIQKPRNIRLWYNTVLNFLARTLSPAKDA